MTRPTAAFVLGAALAATGFLVHQGTRAPVLEVGDRLSSVMVHGTNGDARPLPVDGVGQTRVVLFSPACSSCAAQMEHVEPALDRLADGRIVLVAVGDSVPLDYLGRWPALLSSPDVVVGRMAPTDVRERLGEGLVPTTLVFDHEGRLTSRARGRVDMAFP